MSSQKTSNCVSNSDWLTKIRIDVEKEVGHKVTDEILYRAIIDLLARQVELGKPVCMGSPLPLDVADGTRTNIADLESQLQRRAVDAILGGTRWLSATEVSEKFKPNAVNKHAFAARLLNEKRVFAIKHDGKNKFPEYAFDTWGNSVHEMREVLALFRNYSSFRIASWFESTSSALGGRRPREVFSENPKAVVAAARDHVEGPLHG
jgi:hypothetical protein